MNKEDILDKMRSALLDLDSDAVNSMVDEALKNDIRAIDILNKGLASALERLGELFAEEEVFLPELLKGADITLKVMNRLEDQLKNTDEIEKRGRVLLCTVEGDVHDIGRALVGMVMTACGYVVIDGGKNVKNEKVVEMVREHKPDILGMSALLLTTMPSQAKVIEIAKEAGLRDQVKIMVGGAPVSRDWADKIGADGFSEDASSAVIEADKLLGIVK